MKTVALSRDNIENSFISTKYQNLHDISVIANVILYDGDINYTNERWQIGMNIYNSQFRIEEIKDDEDTD